jgi:hypothetical protein
MAKCNWPWPENYRFRCTHAFRHLADGLSKVEDYGYGVGLCPVAFSMPTILQ